MPNKSVPLITYVIEAIKNVSSPVFFLSLEDRKATACHDTEKAVSTMPSFLKT